MKAGPVGLLIVRVWLGAVLLSRLPQKLTDAANNATSVVCGLPATITV